MFPNPNEEKYVPAEKVKFTELRVEPQTDRLKVRVYAQKPPSKEFPTIELAILDSVGHVLTETTMITVFQEEFVLTMHLPGNKLDNPPFVLHGKIIFEDSVGLTDYRKFEFNLLDVL
jgi:hypothetical protein